MPKKQKNIRHKPTLPIGKQVGKQQIEKKSDFYHKHKNTIWTIIVLVVLAIFFVINNTRKIPEQGSYPPNYIGGSSSNEATQQ